MSYCSEMLEKITGVKPLSHRDFQSHPGFLIYAYTRKEG